MDSDLDVIKLVMQGDRDAFEVLLRRHSQRVFTVVGRRVPVDAVEPVAQDVFVSAFRSLGLYEPQEPFEHWLLRIARRRCCDYWRRRWRRRETPDTMLSDEQSSQLERAQAERSASAFGRDCGQAETEELVSRALEHLSPEDRLLVECIYFDELPLKEVAETLNWSLPKVKVRAFRVRRKLRGVIENLAGGSITCT